MAKRFIRLGFDARLAGSAHAGIGRYSEELLRELLCLSQTDPRIEWRVFLGIKNQLPWLSEYSQVTTQLLPVRHYTLREQVQALQSFWFAQLDLLHVPHFNVPIGYRRPFVVTIHDLLWHTQRDPRATTLPAWQHRLKYGAYRYVSQSAMQRAQAILVPTNYVKEQVAAYVDDPAKIVVTSEGVSRFFLQSPTVGQEKRASKTKERAPYLVYTGSLYPHKNIEVVLQALQEIPYLQLKVVTARSIFLDHFWQRATDLEVSDQVEVLHALSDREVRKLYQGAVALVQPSLSEGFGLTGVEALATGCPVVASDIPVFHEVYQQHAKYFDPHSSSQLVEVLRQILRRPVSRAKLFAAQEFAQRYRWATAAKKTWQVYQDLLPRV